MRRKRRVCGKNSLLQVDDIPSPPSAAAGGGYNCYDYTLTEKNFVEQQGPGMSSEVCGSGIREYAVSLQPARFPAPAPQASF